jgi:hypothetical protein
MQKLVSTSIFILLIVKLASQNEDNIDPVEIKIVKDYNVFIEEASKIHEPISYYPQFKDKTTQKKLNYLLPDRIEQFKFEPSAIEPIAYKQRNVFFKNTNFVRMGFGSAFNPIFEWSHLDEKAKTPNRLHVFHHSAWLSPDSFQKYSETRGEAEITKSFKNWIFKPRIQAQHKYYNFYGNIVESGFQKESIRNYFNGGIVVTMQKEKSELKSLSVINVGEFNYGMDNLGILDTTKKNHEAYGLLKSDLSYRLMENILIKLNTGVQYYNLTTDTFSDKWLINAMPNAEFRMKALKLTGGLNFTQSLINSRPIFYVFPHFISEVQLVPNYLNFYTVWNRNLELNRLQSHLAVNPFIIFTNQLLPNTLTENRTAGLKGGYKGISYQAFFNQKIMKNTLLFQNDAANPRFLQAETERNMTVNNISLELSYIREEKWSAFIKGDLFLYELDRIGALPNNLPGQRLTLGSHFKASKKLNINFNAYALGGVKTLISGIEVSNTLLFDLNIGGEYHISKNFYIFANGNNMLNSKIAHQIGFPSIGINGQGGLRITY